MTNKNTGKKYKILIDYGIYEGMKFWDKGHKSVDSAVKVAQANSYGFKFYIIQIVDWRAHVKSK